MASFKIHMVRKDGYQDSIGKKSFYAILDVCNITFDLGNYYYYKCYYYYHYYNHRLR